MSTAAAAGPLSDAAAAAPATAGATALPAPATGTCCDNCGEPVPGRYCASCGQRREAPLHSLWHFTKVAAEDLTHADSRLWRTLGALLFRPGRLTREFLSGRRARYLPPVRLYLVVSLVFFLWASSSHQVAVVTFSTPEHGAPTASVTTHEDDDEEILGKPLPGESAAQRAERVCASGVNYDGPWQRQIQPAARNACVRMLADNFHSLREAFLHNLPRAMFLFLPLLAAAMMLLYWRPRHYYIEHLLLFVHNHAFVFLAVMLAAAAAALLPAGARLLRLACTLYIAWYVYRSMRVVYGQGRWLTLGKFALLSLFYLVSGAVTLLLTFVTSALTL